MSRYYNKGEYKIVLEDRRSWDWSLSDCALARKHSVGRMSVFYSRKLLGIPPWRQKKQVKIKGLPTRGPKAPKAIPVEFLSKAIAAYLVRCIRRGEDECWSWSGSKNYGYGVVSVRIGAVTKTFKAHRIAYAIRFGNAPAGKLLRHSCDNPECSNPNHLLPGTTLDNARDAVERGGLNQGEKNGMSKFSNSTLLAIRDCLDTGDRPCDIAAELNVPRHLVYSFRSGRAWKHMRV